MATKNTEVVKVTAEIVPSTKMEGLQLALNALTKGAEILPELKAESEAIAITDEPSYARAGELLVRIRNVGKIGPNKMNPYLDIAKKIGDYLRNKRTLHETQANAVADPLAERMAEYKRNERLAAEAETRRTNEERLRKANEEAARVKREQEQIAKETWEARVKELNRQLKAKDITKQEFAKLLRDAGATEEAQIAQADLDAQDIKFNVQSATVKPATVAIAGTRARVQYFAEVEDAEKFLHAYRNNPQGPLRRFISIDCSELAAAARDLKDSAKMMETYPGVRAWDKDKI